jgi:hypothetical protein
MPELPGIGDRDGVRADRIVQTQALEFRAKFKASEV